MQLPSLFGMTALAGLASAAVLPRTGTTDIQFCTASTYATGACPYAQPTAGAGTCGALSVEANVCYTFADFPLAPAALIGDVNYVEIPSGGSITGCNLYKTTDCTVTPDQSWAATEVGGTDLTCRKHLTANIVSWICA
ncbi:hypothetical protein KVR01_002627 [Diaporthe batatas]|uniref:uncharacterized protein n=1 Tax=Diaporthe batatas TaxID=748121 RepID=UPI001D04ACC9|nr:uncharacterized protein KVR01_002627 [Diaporthe batatas]KAG8166938.1 hypothetical protein KVR01_002627 [Diaporthe batatas]